MWRVGLWGFEEPSSPIRSCCRASSSSNYSVYSSFSSIILFLSFFFHYQLTYSVIQAAQKAAENATLVPRVDVQVNNAVSAGKRAATAARVAAIKAVQNRINGKFCETDV